MNFINRIKTRPKFVIELSYWFKKDYLMKKAALLFVSLLFINVFATAQEENTSSSSDSHLTIGPELRYYRYVEPGLIQHTGALYGVWANWFYQLGSFKGVIDANLIIGNLKYDGALCDTNTSVCTDYSSTTNEMIHRVTHRFDYQVTSDLHVFAGGGFRYLYDKGEGVGFYTRSGTYLFLPVGVTYNLSDFSLDVEYDIFLGGTMVSKLSDVNSTYGDITHTQKTGYGIQVTAGYHAKPISYYLFYETWNVRDSDTVELKINGAPSGLYFTEPKNFSESWGFKVGWAF